MPASQHSESQTLSSHCTIWVENSSGMNHGSRILNSHCKGQRTTAMWYHTSLIKLPDIYQPEYRPWQWQGKKKSKRSFSENHCWWTQSLRYNYKTTLSLSKALRISPLRFFSKPSQIQWLIKQFQRTIILGCDSHDCELWLTPNHQDNFYMNTWSCIVCVCRGGALLSFNRSLRCNHFPVFVWFWSCVPWTEGKSFSILSLRFLICEMGALMLALLEAWEDGTQLPLAFLRWLAESQALQGK